MLLKTEMKISSLKRDFRTPDHDQKGEIPNDGVGTAEVSVQNIPPHLYCNKPPTQSPIEHHVTIHSTEHHHTKIAQGRSLPLYNVPQAVQGASGEPHRPIAYNPCVTPHPNTHEDGHPLGAEEEGGR